MTRPKPLLDQLLASGYLPDSLIRVGIRRLLAQKLREETQPDPETQQMAVSDFVHELKKLPIALKTKEANAQHYEVPTEFFRNVLGPRMKYSSGYFDSPHATLAEAEEAMLKLTTHRARLEDGQRILELGCGWGSLTLWMAETFPNARITGVSNSASQRQYIEEVCRVRGFEHVEIVTADMNHFSPLGHYDRVVSVEMFEHMKNYEALLKRIASWLVPSGLLFVHIFTHRSFPYHFEGTDPSDWITRYFFEGGMMPSDNLLLYFQEDLRIQDHWCVSGRHYQQTSEAWLQNMDANAAAITPILESVYGAKDREMWRNYWRIFFMACAELWGYRKGEEWRVSHYLFER